MEIFEDTSVLNSAQPLHHSIPIRYPNGVRNVLQTIGDAANFLCLAVETQATHQFLWQTAVSSVAEAHANPMAKNASRAGTAIYNLAKASGHLEDE